MRSVTSATSPSERSNEASDTRVLPFPEPSWRAVVTLPREGEIARLADPGWTDVYVRLKQNPGDAGAYAALYARVKRWADRQLSSPTALREQSEDVVADTCAAAILGLDRAYGPDTFAGFVYGHFLSARRRYLRAVRIETVPIDDLPLAESTDQSPTSDELALLQRCLLQLTPRERRAVELRYFSEASSREIAEALGVTETNARRIVFNGLAHLRRAAVVAWPAGRQI